MANSPTPFSPLQGVDALPKPISDYQSDETIGTQLAKNLCSLPLQPALKKRKIYAWIFTTVANATDNYIKATVRFYRNAQQVGILPLGIGNASGVNAKLGASLASIATSGGVNASDSIGLTVSAPTGGEPVNLILQPQLINGEADQVSISVDELWQVTGYRIYFAVISSN